MKLFHVYLNWGKSSHQTIEAENEEQAEEIALENMSSENTSEYSTTKIIEKK